MKSTNNIPKIKLDDNQAVDVKNIARGTYYPLKGFLNKNDFISVIERMHLTTGEIWPIPITLDVCKEKAKELDKHTFTELIDNNNKLIATLKIEDLFTYETNKLNTCIYSTTDKKHPGVNFTNQMNKVLVGGQIKPILDDKEPFPKYNKTPKETKTIFKKKGWTTIAGFQTRNVSHRAHEYLQRLALEFCDGLFINPVIGGKKPGDFHDPVILKAYKHLISNYFPDDRVFMSILPLRMRYAGPREAIFHALIRKNFGCTHFIVGRDHAGVGDFYGPFDAQNIFDQFSSKELGIEILKFDNSFYCRKCGSMATSRTCCHEDKYHVNPSGTLIRDLISQGKPVPEEIMRPDISEILINENKTFIE